jgi:hypothetical protein
MTIKAEPFGKEYRLDQQSDIVEVTFSYTIGLRLTVIAATTMFTNIYLDLHFPSVIGFRYLDESDFPNFGESKDIHSNHHVYKILSGGWATLEPLPPELSSVTVEFEPFEWFIKTTNGCMNVLSSGEPVMREFTNGSISSK